MFAGTPPLEAPKLIISKVASSQTNMEEDDPVRLMYVDVKRAYFYAPCTSETYIKIPEEDWEPGDEGKCGRLNVSLYGTREAAGNWQREYTSFMLQNGFKCGQASACAFLHKERVLRIIVHGDDFVCAGRASQLHWFRKGIEKKYDVKVEMLGPDPNTQKQVCILNWCITWGENRIKYEADRRHAEKIVEEMDLVVGKVAVTPGVTEKIDEQMADKAVSKEASRKYRSVTARANYLAADKVDIQYAVKECSKSMATPKNTDLPKLKRLGRYLKSHPRLQQVFDFGDNQSKLRTQSDSDWAGNKITRKSTSGGTVRLGKHLIKSWSKDQAVIATSSGEAELYALNKAASESLGIQSIARDLGIDLSIQLEIDAKATRGMISRIGLGKMRHIEVAGIY